MLIICQNSEWNRSELSQALAEKGYSESDIEIICKDDEDAIWEGAFSHLLHDTDVADDATTVRSFRRISGQYTKGHGYFIDCGCASTDNAEAQKVGKEIRNQLRAELTIWSWDI